MKKLMSLLLVMTVIASALAGCNSKSQGNDTTIGKSSESPSNAREKMDISIAHWDIEKALSGGNNDPLLQKLQDDLNITIKPVNTTWDDYAQKIQLWASSNQLPDIFSVDVIGTSNFNTWVEKGIVKPLPTDLSKYPNLQKYLDVNDIQALKRDGKLYNIPRKTWDSEEYNSLDRPLVYRWDLAQAAGITKEPENWDEFQEMLRAIIKHNSEKKNITGLTATTPSILDGLFFTYSLPAAMSDGSGSDYKWLQKDGQYVPAYFANDPLPTFNLARSMYTNGLIDPDIANSKVDIAYDKFLQGQVAALQMSGGLTAINQKISAKWNEIYPDKKFSDSVRMMKPMPAVDGNKYYSMFKTYWSELYINNKVDDKKMERILELIEYFLSPEYKNMLRYGVENEDYVMENDEVKLIGQNADLSTKYPFSTVIGLVEWDQGTTEFKGPTTYPEIRTWGEDYLQVIKNETTVPEFDMRLTYLSTPLKDKFIIKPADDLIKVMMSNEPVETIWGSLYQKYKDAGLDQMINEVNKVAKEQGIIN